MNAVTNWGTALFNSIAGVLSLVVAFIPRLVGFLVILLIGWIVASALAKAVTFLLKRIGFDRTSERIGLTRFEQRMGMRMDPATLLGKIVYWFVFLVFLIPAFNALQLTSVSSFLNQVLAYIPNIFVAVLVLFLGALLASFVGDIVRGTMAGRNVGNPNIYANIARAAIIGFAILVALDQLQIAPALITILFTAIVGAIALALGLAFGLGGRDTAQRLLDRGEARIGTTPAPYSATQPQTQATDIRQPFNQPSPGMGRMQSGTMRGDGSSTV
ncbi:MAG TPA: hypothetical protein VL461_10380 [Dictyobacter sp.]|jgi:hypothetical protein|nr:hypothetical protein [Dictyobacter sp.]